MCLIKKALRLLRIGEHLLNDAPHLGLNDLGQHSVGIATKDLAHETGLALSRPSVLVIGDLPAIAVRGLSAHPLAACSALQDSREWKRILDPVMGPVMPEVLFHDLLDFLESVLINDRRPHRPRRALLTFDLVDLDSDVGFVSLPGGAQTARYWPQCREPFHRRRLSCRNFPEDLRIHTRAPASAPKSPRSP